MKILRCWCSTPSGDKLFAINLPFTTKQYKVDNIANFVYYGKTRVMMDVFFLNLNWVKSIKSLNTLTHLFVLLTTTKKPTFLPALVSCFIYANQHK